uniref:Uncharacterized protein n=1 Tax=Plectus sambesii TaxID=2011161 RepID=A0A914XG28_9BILA
MVKVCLNQMKKLSNGSEKQQYKEMLVRSVIWDICMRMGKAYLNQMKKHSNGTVKPQYKKGKVSHFLMKKLRNGSEKLQNKVMLTLN